MMEYICYVKKENLGTVSSESLLQVLLKMWILQALNRSGFSITGLRIFLLSGDKKIAVSEMETPDVRIWDGREEKSLVLANQNGNVWIHKNRNMDAFHPAKDEEIYSVLRKKMGIKEIVQKKESREDTQNEG